MAKIKTNLLDPRGVSRTRRAREWFFVLSFAVVVFAFFQSLSLIQKSFLSPPPPPEKSSRVLGLTDTVKTIGSALELAKGAAPYADFAGNILGKGGRDARYLILFQNNAELRATGGFLGSYALIHVADGTVRDIEIPGGGLYDLAGTDVTRVRAPQPLTLFSPRWEIWNANWFRDFPTSAGKIMWFYERAGGPTIDGVIAIQPSLIERLLELTGPIELPDYSLTVDARHFYETIQTQVEYGYDKKINQPKAVIGALTRQLLPKVTALAPTRATDLVKIFSDELEKQRIQFSFTDPALARFVFDHSWDGAMLPAEQDYASLVYTNIGGGKTDRVTKNIGELTITITRDGSVEHAVKLYRAHQGEKGNPLYDLPNVDYLRFYAPAHSRLQDADGFDTIPPSLFKKETESLTGDLLLHTVEHESAFAKQNTRITQETYGSVDDADPHPPRSYTSFGNWMIVNPGEKRIVSMSYESGYRLPRDTRPWYQRFWNAVTFRPIPQEPYVLRFQKQSGVDADVWKIRVIVERGLHISSVTPAPAGQDSNAVTWIVDTSQNHEFRVMIE